MKAAAWVFWLSAFWLFYVWIGYPLALRAISLFRRFHPVTSDDYFPMVSVLISARNEERDIGWKLLETLEWDYPNERLEVLVGSDASSDGTDETIHSFRDQRLRFLRNQERAGKSTTLNRLVRLAHGDLLFFTDANTHIDPGCLKRMVRYFVDPRVGCVTGMERNVTGSHVSTMAVSSTTYLEYEGMVDRLESDLGSVLICDGSVYCLRRSLFTDLDPDLANDLEHPIRAGAGGAAILYEPEARSIEYCSSSPSEEFSRRRRIAAQGALAMWRLRHELRGFRLWQFLSRKFSRWLTVLPMIAALIASIVLRREPLFRALLLPETGFYALAVIGSLLEGKARANAVLRMPFVFLLAHAAVFLGFIDACRQKTFSTWNTAELSRGVPRHTNSVTQESST